MTGKVLQKIALYLWQLPQNLLGVLFGLYLKGDAVPCGNAAVRVRSSSKMQGGICLGRYIYLSPSCTDNTTIKHELGHYYQSRLLGPLYLLVIGLPSLLWAALYGAVSPAASYYWFYTEAWADKLGGVER